MEEESGLSQKESGRGGDLPLEDALRRQVEVEGGEEAGDGSAGQMQGLEPDDRVGHAAQLRGLKQLSLSGSLFAYFFCATTPERERALS